MSIQQRTQILQILYDEHFKGSSKLDRELLIEQMHINLDGIQPEIVYLEEDGYIKLKRQQIGVRIFTSLSITAKGINFIEVNSMSENSRPHIDALLLPSDVIQGKMATNAFDVFLCYHNIDNAFVKHIGEQLKARGLLPWLDEWELRPGLSWQRLLEDQIEHIKSVAVFVGANGIGPWQQMEMDAFLREFVRRGCPVIPVILPDTPKEPRLPLFLAGLTWVDFRKPEPESLARLIWGITGQKG
jgi:TIR domain